jgi:hypothetical protein
MTQPARHPWLALAVLAVLLDAGQPATSDLANAQADYATRLE